MNNSFKLDDSLVLEDTPVNTDVLSEKEGKLIILIEAVAKIQKTAEWRSLKTVLDGEIERLERLQAQEAGKSDLNLPELYRLQGRILQAKHHSISALEAKWRSELLQVRKLTPLTSQGT